GGLGDRLAVLEEVAGRVRMRAQVRAHREAGRSPRRPGPQPRRLPPGKRNVSGPGRGLLGDHARDVVDLHGYRLPHAPDGLLLRVPLRDVRIVALVVRIHGDLAVLRVAAVTDGDRADPRRNDPVHDDGDEQ